MLHQFIGIPAHFNELFAYVHSFWSHAQVYGFCLNPQDGSCPCKTPVFVGDHLALVDDTDIEMVEHVRLFNRGCNMPCILHNVLFLAS